MPSIAPLSWIALSLGASPWLIAAAPLVLLFCCVTAMYHLIGRDHRNVSGDVLHDLENDPYYRRMMFGVTAGFVIATYFACAMAVSGAFNLPQVIVSCMGLGCIHAPLVLIGHELGHAVRSKRDLRVAPLVGYGHFTIEHNSGHHIKVATPMRKNLFRSWPMWMARQSCHRAVRAFSS